MANDIGKWVEAPSQREVPPTQNGQTPEFPSDVGFQSTRIAADPVLMADGPTGGPDRGNTPVEPEGGPTDGAGSIGPNIEGWHPQADEG